MWDEPVSPKPQSGEGGLNTTIDEVAREMTEGSPADAAAFRRQVLARIDAGAAPRRSWRAAFVLSPIAAAIAIAVAVFVSRDTVRVPPATTAAPQVAVAPPPAAPTAIPATETAASPIIAAAPRRADARGVEPGAEADSQIDPIAPITVAPLTVAALSPDPIPIERLDAVTPITVAPLDISDAQRREP